MNLKLTLSSQQAYKFFHNRAVARCFIDLFFSVTFLGQGQGPARQAAMNAGIPSSVPAYGVNMLCGSGLKAVALGYQAVLNDESAVIVAGGQESMSQVTVSFLP